MLLFFLSLFWFTLVCCTILYLYFNININFLISAPWTTGDAEWNDKQLWDQWHRQGVCEWYSLFLCKHVCVCVGGWVWTLLLILQCNHINNTATTTSHSAKLQLHVSHWQQKCEPKVWTESYLLFSAKAKNTCTIETEYWTNLHF